MVRGHKTRAGGGAESGYGLRQVRGERYAGDTRAVEASAHIKSEGAAGHEVGEVDGGVEKLLAHAAAERDIGRALTREVLRGEEGKGGQLVIRNAYDDSAVASLERARLEGAVRRRVRTLFIFRRN